MRDGAKAVDGLGRLSRSEFGREATKAEAWLLRELSVCKRSVDIKFSFKQSRYI